MALSGFPPPPAFAALPPQSVSSTWNGYVKGEPRPITAYVLEPDRRSLCAIGTQELHHPATEVPFQDLQSLLPASPPDSPPELSGGWVPDGYYKGSGTPGPPPVDGRVFGSFPDASTGTLRIGPYHLDGKTQIAIPVVTGPDNHDLTLTVRDAVSK